MLTLIILIFINYQWEVLDAGLKHISVTILSK